MLLFRPGRGWLVVFESIIYNYFMTTRESEFQGYLPYTIVIGAILIWFIGGIVRDALRDLTRVRRRRRLLLVVREKLVRSSYVAHYIGEVGPCVGSRLRPRWECWLASLEAKGSFWPTFLGLDGGTSSLHSKGRHVIRARTHLQVVTYPRASA